MHSASIETGPLDGNEVIVSSPYKRISWPSRILRKIAGAKARKSFPATVVELPETNGLSRARELAKIGYSILVVSTHPTQGEIIRELDVIGEDPVLGDRELGVPETPKHYKWWHGIGGKSAGISVFPVSNEDSVAYFKTPPDEKDKKERAKYNRKLAMYNRLLKKAGKRFVAKHPEEREKYKSNPAMQKRISRKALTEIYLDNTVHIMDQGGANLIYVQGGRRPFLGAITPAVSKIIERANEQKVKRYAITTMGVAIYDENGEEIEDYGDPAITGYNEGLEYVFTVGVTDTTTEFQKEAKKRGLTWDELLLDKLRAVSSRNYQPREVKLP